MKTQYISILSVISILAGAAVLGTGCAGSATRESTGEYVDSAAITAKVKAALVSDDTVRARDVQVETFRSTVQLSGFVDTEEQKQRATLLARSVAGVTEVKNNIIVKKE